MLYFENLSKYSGIAHGILEREEIPFNLSFLNFPKEFRNSKEKRERLRKIISPKEQKVGKLITAQQIHSTKVSYINPKDQDYTQPNADALITKVPKHVLIIKTADCIPILAYNPKDNMIAAIHAGRKGLLEGIIENTLEKFSALDETIIGIGPHIRKEHYYLKEEAKDYILNSRWKKYSKQRGQKTYLDLTQITIDKLLKCGIKKENIEDCKICTYCKAKRFYSARAKEENPELYRSKKNTIPCFPSFISLTS